MRPIHGAGLAAVLAISVWASTARAQQPYWQRAASTSAAARGDEAADLLRPYGSRAASAAERRPYNRQPTRVEPTRAVMPAARRDYFPGQRTGVYPNRNYVPPERLCVPGRRAFFYR